MEKPDRTIPKPPIPLKSILGISAIGLGLMAFIIFAIWQSGTDIQDAIMRGVVIEKKFTPQAERQITVGESGLSAQNQDGEFTLLVEVKQRDGVIKVYTVWLDKERYDNVEVGDSFDVGPYVVP